MLLSQRGLILFYSGAIPVCPDSGTANEKMIREHRDDGLLLAGHLQVGHVERRRNSHLANCCAGREPISAFFPREGCFKEHLPDFDLPPAESPMRMSLSQGQAPGGILTSYVCQGQDRRHPSLLNVSSFPSVSRLRERPYNRIGAPAAQCLSCFCKCRKLLGGVNGTF